MKFFLLLTSVCSFCHHAVFRGLFKPVFLGSAGRPVRLVRMVRFLRSINSPLDDVVPQATGLLAEIVKEKASIH